MEKFTIQLQWYSKKKEKIKKREIIKILELIKDEFAFIEEKAHITLKEIGGYAGTS